MNYIVYDLEATCWDGRPPGLEQETIEIGAIKLNRYGEVTGSYNRFIKPILNPFLSPFCKNLTTITQEDVDKALTFPSVINEFQDWLGLYDDDEYHLCSWGSFDRTMLIRDCELHRLEFDWLDAHINLKRQYHRMKRLHRPCGLRNAVKKEGFEFTGIPHRGISDAENLTKIFMKYLEEWEL